MGEIGSMSLSKSEYLQTLQGKISRYNYNKWNRRLWTIIYPNKLKSKDMINHKEELDFQKLILQELKRLRKRAFRSKIILEVIFSAGVENQTQIHTLAKNYLDLFGKPISKDFGRKGLIYFDDSQIEILSIKHKLKPHFITKKYPDKQNSIEIYAMNIKKFMECLPIACDLYQKIENDNSLWQEETKETSKKVFDADILSICNSYFNSYFGQYLGQCLCSDYDFDFDLGFIDFMPKKDRIKLIKQLKEISLQRYIANIFAIDEHKLCSTLLHESFWWNLLKETSEFSNIIRIDLSNFSKTKEIKQKIKNNLISLKGTSFSKLPLRVPISLTILLPKNFIKSSLKDLDNFVREVIIPPFLDIFQPPPILRLDWSIISNFYEKHFTQNTIDIIDTLKSLESLAKRSIIRSYTIIVTDSLEGEFFIIFSNLEQEISIFKTLDNIVSLASKKFECKHLFYD